MKKRLLQVLLSITMMICMMPVVHAEEKIEMKDAMVSNTECINEYVLEVIDQYVSINDQDQFYITDDTTLRSLVTQEQYDVICAQIKARNDAELINSTANLSQAAGKIKSKGSVSTLSAAAIGTAGNPYILSNGITRSVSTSDYVWFELTNAGAFDFKVTSGRSATYYVYKKSLFGLTQLTSGTVNGTVKTYSTTSVNGSNKIQVKVQLSTKTKTTVTCNVKQHIDTRTASYNGSTRYLWTVASTSAIQNPSFIAVKRWYIPASQVYQIYNYANDSKFLTWQQWLLNGTVGASTVAIQAGVPVAIVLTVLGVIATTTDATNFKSVSLNKIRSCGGYISSTDRYSYGIIINKHISNGTNYYTIERWNTSIVTGENGYTGTWTN